jgi:hypothetical protein
MTTRAIVAIMPIETRAIIILRKSLSFINSPYIYIIDDIISIEIAMIAATTRPTTVPVIIMAILSFFLFASSPFALQKRTISTIRSGRGSITIIIKRIVRIIEESIFIPPYKVAKV